MDLTHFETNKTNSSFGLRIHYGGFGIINANDYAVITIENTWITLPVILEGEVIIWN